MKKKDVILKRELLLILVSVCLILAFNIVLIKHDYIAEDPIPDQGESFITLDYDKPIRFMVHPTSTRLYAIDLGIMINQKQADGSVVVNVYEDETLIDNEKISIDTLADGERETNHDYNILYKRLVFKTPIAVSLEKSYAVEFSSTIDERDGAIKLRLTPDKEIWYRFSYLWIKKSTLFIISVAIEILLSLLIIGALFKIKKLKIEEIFLIISVPLCILFTFVMPVYRVPDEMQHYLRTISIIKGYFVIPTDGMISAANNLAASWLKPPFRGYFSPYITVTQFNNYLSSNTLKYNVVGAAVYNPISYCFTVLGIWAAELFSNNLYIIFWGGRLANALGSTILLYFAIKIIPYGKGLILLISLLPMNLQERASFSADAITFAATVLLIAYILYLRSNQKQIGLSHGLCLYLLIILVASCKIVYVVFAGLILLLPDKQYVSKRVARMYKAGGLVLAAVVSVGWLKIASNYLQLTNGGGNSFEKISFILRHPIKYFKVIVFTTSENSITWIKEMIAYPLGHLEILINTKLFLVIIFILILYFGITLTLNRLHHCRNDYYVSFSLLFCSVAVFLLICTSLYLQWTKGTPDDISIISGIQGRYFLPILPSVMLAFIATKTRSTQNETISICACFGTLMYICNLLVLLQIFLYFSTI